MIIKNDIKSRLITSLVFISFIVALTVGIVTFTITSRIVVDEMKEQSYEITKAVNELFIKEFISAKQSELDKLADEFTLSVSSGTDSRLLWSKYLEFMGEINLVYYGYETGRLISYPQITLPPGYDPRERGWYKNSKDNPQKLIWSPPYIDTATGELVLTLGKGLIINNRFHGVIAVDILLNDFSSIIGQIDLGLADNIILTDHGGLIIASKNSGQIGKNLKEIDRGFTGVYENNETVFEMKINGQNSFVSSITAAGTEWKLISIIPVRSIREKISPIAFTTLGITIISVIVSLILAFFISNFISITINKVAESLSEGSKQILQTSRELAKASTEISNGATEQAASIEETTASMEELAAMVRQNAQNSEQTTLLALKMTNISNSSYEQMSKMLESMNDIEKSSEEIRNVIDIIDNIAFQTNMLALNAAVEAARAGEAGMGFAVVADEVKDLATRSAESARETNKMVKSTINSIAAGKELAKALLMTYKDLMDIINKVTNMNQEVELASKQQDIGIQQINEAISQLDKVVQLNAASSEETASAAEELQGQVDSVNNYVEELLVLVEGEKRHNRTNKIEEYEED